MPTESNGQDASRKIVFHFAQSALFCNTKPAIKATSDAVRQNNNAPTAPLPVRREQPDGLPPRHFHYALEEHNEYQQDNQVCQNNHPLSTCKDQIQPPSDHNYSDAWENIAIHKNLHFS